MITVLGARLDTFVSASIAATCLDGAIGETEEKSGMGNWSVAEEMIVISNSSVSLDSFVEHGLENKCNYADNQDEQEYQIGEKMFGWILGLNLKCQLSVVSTRRNGLSISAHKVSGSLRSF